MEISEHGKEKIKAWKVPGPGLIGTRKLTIGVGHLLTPSELASGNILIQGQAVPYAAGLSDPQILDLLGQDLAGAVRPSMRGGGGVEPKSVRHPGLLLLQRRHSAFKNSTLLRLLNLGAYVEVPAQLRRWVRCNGEVAPGWSAAGSMNWSYGRADAR